MATPNTNTTGATTGYPANWQAGDFNPADHMMQLKGRDYLNVQARMQWFIRDQRALIVAGLATMPYVIRTEIVEHNPERQYAHFLTYVRDVLGNEATMYGSETGKDFADYAEKASTKSLGRALAVLGYGIAAAQEMDEGERVVDTPLESRRQAQRPAQTQQQRPQANAMPRTDQRAATPAPAQDAQPPAHSLRLADRGDAEAATDEAVTAALWEQVKTLAVALSLTKAEKTALNSAHPHDPQAILAEMQRMQRRAS